MRLRLINMIACLLLLGITRPILAQDEIRQYIRLNTNRVRTDSPDSTDFSDLQPIGDAIGDSRVVMLGEQDHGDAPTFLAKTRLIKYLHEKKGFNVVAFETDFIGLHELWKPGLTSDAIDSIVRKTVYPLWSYCDACQPLLHQYLPATQKTNHPLILAGIDDATKLQDYIAGLDRFVRGLPLSPQNLDTFTTRLLPLLKTWGRSAKDPRANAQYIGAMKDLKEKIQAAAGPDNFWAVSIDNLIAADSAFITAGIDYYENMNVRDARLAQNLKWLCERQYPNEKIIVWAHNYHVSKFAGHYPEPFLDSLRTMGTCFTNDTAWMKQTYIIGFTSYEGTAGRLYPHKIYKVDPPQPNSMENWIDKDLDFAFIDFRKFNHDHPAESALFNMSGAVKGNWYHKNAEAQWNRVFDGVFFIRDMYPCKSILTTP